MLMCGEVIVGGNHNVILLSLLQNDQSELDDGSSSIKSECVEITPRWLNNLLPLLMCLQGNKLGSAHEKSLQHVKKIKRVFLDYCAPQSSLSQCKDTFLRMQIIMKICV